MKRKVTETHISEANSEEIITEKKQRKDNGEILKQIKELLADCDDEIDGLRQFLSLLSDADECGLEEYLNSSHECKEIFRLLDNDAGRPSPEKLALLWEILENILLSTSRSKLLNFTTCGQFIVSKLLQNHTKLLYSSLSDAGSTHLAKAALKCMTAMLAQGEHAVQDFINTFDFTLKSLKGISRKRDRKQKPDERTCFVRFCVAFFVFGDTSVMQQVAEEKGLIPLLLTDLHLDTDETIILILSTLLEKFVSAAFLKKTKLSILNAHAMHKLAVLYRNKQVEIRDAVHDFLMTVCTDAERGICFQSKTNEMRSCNPVLLKFLLLIKQQAIEQPPVQELLVRTLAACPDLILPLISRLNLQVEPRCSDAWVKTVTFLTQIWTNLPGMAAIFEHGAFVGKNAQNHDYMIKFAVPSLVSKMQLTAGLKNKSSKVKQLLLKLLLSVTRRCEDLLKKCAQDDKQSIRDGIFKLIPDPAAIIAIRQMAVSQMSDGKADCNKTKDNGEISDEKIEVEEEDVSLQDDLLSSSMELLLSYQHLQAGSLTLSNFNICKLLLFPEDVVDHIDTKIWDLSLSVLVTEPDEMLSNWMERKLPGNTTIIHLALQRYVCSNMQSNTADLACNLICKIMRSGGFSARSDWEIRIWLQNIHKMWHTFEVSELKSRLVDMFADVFASVLSNPYAYMDCVIEEIPQMTDSIDFSLVSVALFNNGTFKALLLENGNKESLLPLLCQSLCEIVVCLQYPLSFSKILEKLSKNLQIANQSSFTDFLILANKLAVCFEECDDESSEEVPTQFDVDDTYASLPLMLHAIVAHLLREDKIIHPSCLTTAFANMSTILSLLKSEASENYFHGIVNIVKVLFVKCEGLKTETYEQHHAEFLNIFSFFQQAFEHIFQNVSKSRIDNISSTILALPWIQSLGNNKEESCWDECAFDLLDAVRTVDASVLQNELFVKISDEIIDRLITANSEKYIDKQLELLNCYAQQASTEFNQNLVCSMVSVLNRNVHSGNTQVKLAEIVTNLVRKGGVSISSAILDQLQACVLATKSEVSARLFRDLLELRPSGSDYSVNVETLRSVLSLSGDVFADVGVLLFKRCAEVRVELQRQIKFDEVTGEHLCSLFLPIVCCMMDEDNSELSESLTNLCWLGVWSEIKAIGEGNKNPSIECRYLFDSLQKFAPFIEGKKAKVVLLAACQLFRNSDHLPGVFIVKLLDFSMKLLEERKGEAYYQKARIQFLTALITTLKNAMSANDGKEAVVLESPEGTALKYLHTMLQSTNNFDLSISKLEGIVDVWSDLVRLVLKKRFTEAYVMSMIARLVKFLYSCKKFGKSSRLSLPALHQLIVSHSKFLQILFQAESAETKEAILEVVAVVTSMRSDVVNASLMPIFLSAYGATMSKADQYILQLLTIYERQGIALPDPLVWGEPAMKLLLPTANNKQTLLSARTAMKTLELIDAKIMATSASSFPLQRDFDCDVEMLVPADVYDPAFILPLLCRLLETDVDMSIDCRQFVVLGCLSFTLTALASQADLVRLTGYQILSMFMNRLDDAKFKEKAQLSYLLMVLKNSVTEANMKLPNVWCAFFARCAKSFIKPERHMYSVLNALILHKPVFQFSEMPVFLPLFNSSHPEQHNVERSWLLRLLVDGLRDATDYYIYKRQHVLQLSMAFFDATFADEAAKLSVLSLLLAASHIHEAAYDLVRNSALITWLHVHFANDRSSSAQHALTCSIVEQLCRTFAKGLPNREAKLAGDGDTEIINVVEDETETQSGEGGDAVSVETPSGGDDASVETPLGEGGDCVEDVAVSVVNMPRVFPQQCALVCESALRNSSKLSAADLSKITFTIGWFLDNVKIEDAIWKRLRKQSESILQRIDE